MRRRLVLGCLVLFLLARPAMLPADTLQDIDKAVAQLSAFVRRTVPDQEGFSVAVLAFSSDRAGRILLGDRLKTELELSLAASYSRTRVVSRPEGLRTYTVAGEIQAYPGTVRVVCRITRPDGSLGGGTRADIPSSPGLESLLHPMGSAGQPEVPVSPGGQGLHDLPGIPGEGAPAGDDPLEPDDIAGFEVQVPEGGFQIYARAITQGDIDRFRFYAGGTSTTVVLEVQTTIDLQLLVFREGENVPFEVAGSRGSETLRVPLNLPEGYYIVEVMAYDLNVLGRYTLAVDLTGSSDDDLEPDDTREQARPILPGQRQRRALLPRDVDWAELSYTVPGFYAVYTEGLEVDTRLELYEDSGRLITEDDNGGSASNAFVGLFLGVRKAYARISATGPLDSGAYELAFEKIEPPQVYPSSQALTYARGPRALLLQLRILQPGRYVLDVLPESGFSGTEGASGGLALFALPAMRKLTAQNSRFDLSSGDYLISVSLEDGGPESFALCVASESQAEECRRNARGGGYGHSNR